jgi:hypothetical protein
MPCFATLSFRLFGLFLALNLSACIGMPEDEFVVDPPQSVSELEPLDESASAEQSELAAPNAVVWCSNKSWRVNFYAEPELINVVGFLRCDCYQAQSRGGTVTSYQDLAYEFTCSLD